MVAVRKADAGFTLTEAMVVVVILSLLAAVSSPLFTKDNQARKGRDMAKILAQTLQRARFQAMGDHANIHVMLYRTHIDLYREEVPTVAAPTTTFTWLGTIPGPYPDGPKTVAIWEARTDLNPCSGQDSTLTGSASPPVYLSPRSNEIIFTSLGSTTSNANWRVYLRNELLPNIHPDAGFVVNVSGLTGFISANDKWGPPS